MWNQPEHLDVYFAVPAMGAVLHTLNPRLSVDELSFIVSDAEDRAIIVDESLLEVFETFRSAHDFEHVIVVSRSGSVPEGTIDYDSLIDRFRADASGRSSTSAAPRPCVTRRARPGARRASSTRTARSCCTRSTAALPNAHAISGRDTILPVVPMFHANAWGLPYIAAFAGSGLVLPGPRLDAESVLELLADEQVTVTAGVPTVWMAMLAALDAEPDRWNLEHLRLIIGGGSAVPLSLFEGFERHGLEIVQAWGMTEMSPMGTINRLPAEFDDATPRRAVRVPAARRASRSRSSRSARAATTAS